MPDWGIKKVFNGGAELQVEKSKNGCEHDWTKLKHILDTTDEEFEDRVEMKRMKKREGAEEEILLMKVTTR